VQRVVIPELMDADAGNPRELARALRDLHRINRRFGGIRTTLQMFRQVAEVTGRDRFSMLDVGAASGDVASAVQNAMARRRIRVDVTLTDRSLAHLQMAHAGPRRVVGDALALPFAADSFDLVSCSLLAHHLEPQALLTFIAGALRVCRVAVLVNDLRRSAVSLALVYSGFPMFCRMVRHDSVASVKRAYTIPEMQGMLQRAGAAHVAIAPYYLFRLGAILWKS
jgi:ubiquinone/menaquinone biosynthesis C-methylase UbiE